METTEEQETKRREATAQVQTFFDALGQFKWMDSEPTAELVYYVLDVNGLTVDAHTDEATAQDQAHFLLGSVMVRPVDNG